MKDKFSPISQRVVVKLLVAMLIGTAVLLMQAPSVSAYKLEGVKWANQPPPGTCCAHLQANMSGTYFSIDSLGWQNGAAAWSNSAAFIYWTISTGYSPIQLYDTNNSNVTWDGQTIYQQNAGYFTLVSSYLNYYYTRNDSSSVIRGIAAHELGHAAGLDHSTICPSVMWAYTESCRATTPVFDDQEGIDALY